MIICRRMKRTSALELLGTNFGMLRSVLVLVLLQLVLAGCGGGNGDETSGVDVVADTSKDQAGVDDTEGLPDAATDTQQKTDVLGETQGSDTDTADAEHPDTADVASCETKQTFYLDSDDDMFGDPEHSVEACQRPEGYSIYATDCNDDDLTINPVAEELCDLVDNNCDGGTDTNPDGSPLTKESACDEYNDNGNGMLTAICLEGGWGTGACVDPDECELGMSKVCGLDPDLPGFECVDVAGVARYQPLGSEDTGAFPDGMDNDCDGKVDNDDKYWALIPEGEFQQGKEFDQSGDGPLHVVFLDGYQLAKYETTNRQYQGCVDAGPCSPPSDSSSYTHEDYFGNPDFDNHPVQYINWEQARQFCVWLGGNPEEISKVMDDAYTMDRFTTDIPTESQWEKAARGGLDIPDSNGDLVVNPFPLRDYPWGNESPACEIVNYNMCVGETTEVGSYPGGASPYGAMDMAGNVMELVFDWYNVNYYTNSPLKNPIGPNSGSTKVVRGGSWIFPQYVKTYERDPPQYPLATNLDLGFRCVTNSAP